MAGRREVRLLGEYIGHVTAALRCVMDDVLLHSQERVWMPGDPTPLLSRHDFALEFSQEYHVGGERQRARIEVARYIYQLRTLSGPDGAYKDLLGYHWHPDVDGRGPHVHVYARAAEFDFARRHLTTGHVNAAAFARLLIEELEVEPLPERADDWRTVLAGADAGLSRLGVWTTPAVDAEQR